MSSRTHRSPLAVLTVAALALLVGACTGGPGSTAPSPVASAAGTPPVAVTPSAAASVAPSAAPSAEPVALTVGLGYIPNVQFAPFYLADQAGYYRDAGLDVTFQNKIDPDLITLVGQGAIDVGLADGTSVIPAVSQGIPLTYVATIYGQFPSIVFSKASSGIATPADLDGYEAGHPRSLRLVLDHAPGAAVVGRPDPGGPRDRRVPRLRPGRRGRGRGRGRGDRLRQQRTGPAGIEWRARVGAARGCHHAAAGQRPDRGQGHARGQARRHRGLRRRHAAGHG